MNAQVHFAAVILTGSLSALAQDGGPKTGTHTQWHLNCSGTKDPRDTVVQGHNLVLEAGQKTRDVLVSDGNLSIKKGAQVNNVVVVNGSVTVEAGAKVKGSVVALGGTAKLERKSDVKDSVIWIDDGIHLVNDEGGSLDFNLTVGGKSLGRSLVDEALKGLHGCQVSDEPAAK
jgi:hypothetical protein